MKPSIKYRSELWKLITELPGNLAEIGVAEGRFSKEMAEWPLNYRPLLYLVDRWDSVPGKGDQSSPLAWHLKNYQEAQKRMMPFIGRVTFVRGESSWVAGLIPGDSLSLVYIDADHSYEGVKRDIKAWRSKLVLGGVMAFHDYLNPSCGVHVAVNEFCQANHYPVHLIPENKEEDAGAYFYVDTF